MEDDKRNIEEINSDLAKNLRNMEILVLKTQQEMKKSLDHEKKFSVNWFRFVKKCEDALDLCLYEIISQISTLGYISMARVLRSIQAGININVRFMEQGCAFLQNQLNRRQTEADLEELDGPRRGNRINLHTDGDYSDLTLKASILRVEDDKKGFRMDRVNTDGRNVVVRKQSFDGPKLLKSRKSGAAERAYREEQAFSLQVDNILQKKGNLPQSKIFNLVSHLDHILHQIDPSDAKNARIKIKNEPGKFKRLQDEPDSDDELKDKVDKVEWVRFLIQHKKLTANAEKEPKAEEEANENNVTQDSKENDSVDAVDGDSEYAKLKKQLRNRTDRVIELQKKCRNQEQTIDDLNFQVKHQSLLTMQLEIDFKGMKLIFDEECDKFENERRKNHDLIEKIQQLEKGYEVETASFMQSFMKSLTLQVENAHLNRLIARLEKKVASLQKRKTRDYQPIYGRNNSLAVYQPNVNKKGERSSGQGSHDKDLSVHTNSSKEDENQRSFLEMINKQDGGVEDLAGDGQPGNPQIYWNGQGYSFRDESNAGSQRRRDSSRLTTQLIDEANGYGQPNSRRVSSISKERIPGSPLKAQSKRDNTQKKVTLNQMRRSIIGVPTAGNTTAITGVPKLNKRGSVAAIIKSESKGQSLSDRMHYWNSKELPNIRGPSEELREKLSKSPKKEQNREKENDEEEQVEVEVEMEDEEKEKERENEKERREANKSNESFNTARTSKTILSKLGETKASWGVLTKPLSKSLYKARSQSSSLLMSGQTRLEDYPEVSLNGLTQNLIGRERDRDTSVESLSRLNDINQSKLSFVAEDDYEGAEGVEDIKIKNVIRKNFNKLDWQEEKEIKDLYECLTQSIENMQIYASWLKEIALTKGKEDPNSKSLSKLEIEVEFMQALKSFSGFTSFYLKCIETHKQCGDGCIHISRLRERVKVMITNKSKKKSKSGKLEALMNRTRK